MGAPQPITLTEILHYGSLHQFKGDDLRELTHYIKSLDILYLKMEAARRERESKTKKGAKK